MTAIPTSGAEAERGAVDAAYFAIADGAPVSWRDVEQTGADSAQLDALRLLEDVAGAYRQDPHDPPHATRDVMFRWGALEVHERLGAGSYGEVYRAFDPWLGRVVALKLFRGQGDAGLEEGRRLARLRQRNVLSVYGCGIHDGRAGLWSELIDGRTFAAIVADDGACSVEEGVRIGRDLAQALAAVHAVGLVHGDVKAENVMRERGGRVVLMDFGAGGEARLLAGRRLLAGTPRYLPPEVLDGAPLSAASDLYALGVLLFFLFAARHPYADTEPAKLREAQRHGAPDLHELRPDLPVALCGLVAGCLAADSAQRPRSAAQLAAQLEQLAPRRVALHAPRRRVAQVLLVLVALLGAAALAWAYLATPAAWASTARFERVSNNGNVEIASNATLRVGDRLRLILDSTRETWVYVLNEDAAGTATVLFPLDAGTARNPLAAGASLQLPGGQGSTLAWEVTADSAAEEFVVIAALRPLAQLDSALADWRRAARTRAVGALADIPPAQLRGEQLRQVVALLEHDPQHVRIWQYRFPHRD